MYRQKFPQNTYFLGCPHINHKNICRGVSNWEDKSRCRDFNSLKEMNESILNSINSKVKKDDHLILLGDLCFGPKEKYLEYYKQINCENLYHIYGNHDYNWNTSNNYIFKWSEHYSEIFIEKTLICLFHYPIAIFNECHRGSWLICSHSHGTYYPSTKECLNSNKILDVGWDCFQEPLNYSEVKLIMDKKIFQQNDHHNEKTS